MHSAAVRHRPGPELLLQTTIAVEAKKVYKDVLEAAVADTGFVLRELGPMSVKLSAKPRFRYRYPEDVRFLFSNQQVKDLEVGEATDVLDDPTGRALYLAVCEA